MFFMIALRCLKVTVKSATLALKEATETEYKYSSRPVHRDRAVLL